MKRSLLCAALLVGAFTALDDAAAIDRIEIAIGDTHVNLVAPAGYCALDRTDWPETQLIDFTADGIKSQGERLVYLADCERVRTWREGGSKDAGDILDYQASLGFGNQDVTGAMLKDLCATLRENDNSKKGWIDIVLNAFKSAMKGRYGGAEDTMVAYIVLGHEDTGCYVFSSSVIRSREQVYTVSVLTILKSRLISVHLSRKFGGMDLIKGKAEEVIKHLLDTSRAAATVLVAMNR